jgi:DNA-directed RNA polymerase specialized sigma24 family protein
MPVSATTNCAENETRNDRIRANEEVLIGRIQEGEKDLFLELIRPYQRTVYATLISMLGSKEDAEDVTQDVLLKALARLRQFGRESAFGTGLIQIAINEARMRKRKLRHGIMFSLTKGADDDGAYVPKDFADWRETLQRRWSVLRFVKLWPRLWVYSKSTTGWLLFSAM